MNQELYYTNYYRKFHCIGPACEDTCCAVWEIAVDKKTYEKYKSCPGEWGQLFAGTVDSGTHCLRTKEGQRKECVFFTQDRLCRIHAELGEKMLCRSCRIFPRHMEDYGERREYMLSLACPEAARLILYKMESATLIKKEKSSHRAGTCDRELLKAILDLRESMLQILHRDSLDITDRAGLLLCLAHDVQRPIVQRRWDIVKKKEECYTAETAAERFLRRLGTLPYHTVRPQMKRYLEMLEGLNIADSRFGAMLKEAKRLFTVKESDEFAPLLREFLRIESEKASQKLYENLLEYFLITYFLGAVYDKDIYGKVKFSVFSMLVIREFYFVQYQCSRNAGKINRIEPVVLYSREAENNTYNLEALEVMLGGGEFSLKRLLFLVKCI